MKKDDKTSKNIFKFFFVFFALSFIVFVYFIDTAPFYYCNKWGGTLYNNNECYITTNLSLCIDTNGGLRETKFNLNKNISEVFKSDIIILS